MCFYGPLSICSKATNRLTNLRHCGHSLLTSFNVINPAQIMQIFISRINANIISVEDNLYVYNAHVYIGMHFYPT